MINALGAKITTDPKHNGVPRALLIFIKMTVMNTISCLNERQHMLSGNELEVPSFIEVMGVEMGSSQSHLRGRESAFHQFTKGPYSIYDLEGR